MLSFPLFADEVQATDIPPSTGFDYPVGGTYHEGYEMNNCFGCNYLNYYGHTGEDFYNGVEGGPVYSVSEGMVVYRGVGPGAWGNVMIIQHMDHGWPVYSQYAHLRDMWAVPGQIVGRREQIGTVGMTGTVEPHLHFEIKDQPRIGKGYTDSFWSNRNTIAAWDITYFSPSWWIDNHRYFWNEMPTSKPPPGRHYYWTWYDDIGARNWVLLGNTGDGGDLAFDVNIRGISTDLSIFGGSTVSPGQVGTPTFPGLMGGPVVATSLTNEKALVSQRVIWGESSMEEVTGVEEDKLSDHFWWTWYDEASPGYQNWVLISNPNNAAIYYEIKIANTLRAAGTIAPGANENNNFPGVIGGPVEVRAWTSAAKSVTANVMASQRVLSNGGMAFNEQVGIPDADLSDHSVWTWYDNVGGQNWVLVANPPTAAGPVTYQIKLAGAVMQSGSLAPGEQVTPTFAGRIGGPLEVTASGTVIASQRMVWGPSFGEAPGYPFAALSDNYHWTWYDQASPGMQNWVLLANVDAATDSGYQVKVAGKVMASGTLAPGNRVTPVFPGTIGGPVEVTATGGKTIASQRVLYNGYFNEVTGTVLD
jgi:murein DD-endopeptidase MepM/ murein hydrolase activator NlpD